MATLLDRHCRSITRAPGGGGGDGGGDGDGGGGGGGSWSGGVKTGVDVDGSVVEMDGAEVKVVVGVETGAEVEEGVVEVELETNGMADDFQRAAMASFAALRLLRFC